MRRVSTPSSCPTPNPRAAFKTARGAPNSVAQPLDWAKKHGVQVKDPRWAADAREIDEVLRTAKLRLGRKLGCGSFGCAYLDATHPNRVIKITGDSTEVAAAARVLEARMAGAKLPGVVKFYAVYAVRNRSIFVVVQERLCKLHPNEYRMVEHEQDNIYNVGTSDDMRARRRFIREAAARYRVPPVQIKSLVDVFDQLRRVGVVYHDLHEGNVMRTAKGRLKVIDLGISRSRGAKVPIIPR